MDRMAFLVVLAPPSTDEPLDELDRVRNASDAKDSIIRALRHAGFTVLAVEQQPM